MKDYIVVTSQHLSDLIEDTNRYISVGYIPVGGIAIKPWRPYNSDEFLQALVRKEVLEKT